MNWVPKGEHLRPDFLGNLEPEHVLADYEGPRSFTARGPSGQLLFAHQCGESDDRWRYAVVPFTDDLLSELIGERLDVWSALNQPTLWIVDISLDGTVASCVASSLTEIPQSCRPQKGVKLTGGCADG